MKFVTAFLLVGLATATVVPDCRNGECEEPIMSSSDPKADAMPHDFGPHIPTSHKGVLALMNAYDTKAADPASLKHNMVAMPGSVGAGNTLGESDQIPYDPQPDQPALRRPHNLDEILSLLKSIKADYELEDKHDRTLESSLSEGNSALTSAKSSVDEARSNVKALEAAKDANMTLRVVLENIGLKANLLKEHREEKALLIKEEGMLKTPIVKTVGRTNINLQAAINAKQQALSDFAQHPAFTKEEINEILTTYDELIINLKQQIAALNKEASDVLTPIQLQLNQTDHSIDRVNAEINELKKKQLELEPIAEKYTPQALEGSQLILSDALAHHAAQEAASQLDTQNRDQRSKDRAGLLSLLDELATLISAIQQPQDPKLENLENGKQVVSLLGSLPKIASVDE